MHPEKVVAAPRRWAATTPTLYATADDIVQGPCTSAESTRRCRHSFQRRL